MAICHTRGNIMKIKNIIFDLGGVILEIDFQKTIGAFKSLGATKANTLFQDNKQIIEKFGLGKIETSLFRAEIQNYLDIMVSDQEFDSAWNVMLIGIPKPRLELIKMLKNDYRCFLFSNTNSIHHIAILSMLHREHQIESFASYFENQYYSYEMELRKPDRASYQKILDKNGLQADETLFIDDTLAYIEGAKLIGMHVLHLQSELVQINLPGYINEIEIKSINKSEMRVSVLPFTPPNIK